MSRSGCPAPGRLLVAVPVVMLLVACAGTPGRAPRGPVAPPPPGFSQSGPHVSSWKGKVRVGDEKARFRMEILLAPPDLFLLELRTSVGALMLRAAHDGERIRIVIPREKVRLDEEASPETVERLLGLPLRPADLAAVMVGRPGAPAFADGRPPPDWAPDRSSPTKTALGRTDDPVGVVFGPFVPGGAGLLPGALDLSWEGQDRRIAVHLDLRGGRPREAPAGGFLLQVPTDFRRIRLDDLAGSGPLLLPPSGEDG